MKRRTLLRSAALAVLAALSHAVPRFARAQANVLTQDQRDLIAAIGEAVLPSSLRAEGRAQAVAAFVQWLDGYKAGVPMSHGYGGQIRAAVVPPSPLSKYPAQFARLQALSKPKGAVFPALSPADRRAVVEAALLEARVTKLPDRPDGRHVASDLMGHFYSSSDGNDFLFKASIRVSDCRGLDSSADRPASLT